MAKQFLVKRNETTDNYLISSVFFIKPIKALPIKIKPGTVTEYKFPFRLSLVSADATVGIKWGLSQELMKDGVILHGAVNDIENGSVSIYISGIKEKQYTSKTVAFMGVPFELVLTRAITVDDNSEIRIIG